MAEKEAVAQTFVARFAAKPSAAEAQKLLRISKIFSPKSIALYAAELTKAKTIFEAAVKNQVKLQQVKETQNLPVEAYIFDITDAHLQPLLNADGDIIGYTADRTINKIQLVYNLDSPNLQRQYFNIFAEARDTNGLPINLGDSQGKALPVGAKLSNTQDVSAEGLVSFCVRNKLSTLTVQLTWTTNKIDDCFYIEVEDYDLKKTANGWQARRRARRMPDPTCNPQAATVFKNIYARDNKNDKPINGGTY